LYAVKTPHTLAFPAVLFVHYLPPGTPMRSVRDSRGFTLLELLAVMVVLAVGASLAAPRLNGVATRMRVRAALDQVASDLYHARVLAIREGTRTVVRFTRRTDRSECHAAGYVVVVRTAPEHTAWTTVLDLPASACVRLGTVDSITFNSRGLPDGVGRKVRLDLGGASDSLTFSLLGRTFRYY
jgi:prepilin-type N-terminal cleavage/methylation domain-containing protein